MAFFEVAGLEENSVEKSTVELSMIYPVIVLNGRLMTYQIGGEVKETKHVHYLFELLATEPLPIAGKIISTKPIVIDIVQLDYFREFLELVQTKGVV